MQAMASRAGHVEAFPGPPAAYSAYEVYDTFTMLELCFLPTWIRNMDFWCPETGLFTSLSLGLHCLRGMRGVLLAINHDHYLIGTSYCLHPFQSTGSDS
jgi:hypothetical protein